MDRDLDAIQGAGGTQGNASGSRRKTRRKRGWAVGRAGAAHESRIDKKAHIGGEEGAQVVTGAAGGSALNRKR